MMQLPPAAFNPPPERPLIVEFRYWEVVAGGVFRSTAIARQQKPQATVPAEAVSKGHLLPRLRPLIAMFGAKGWPSEL
jgi:hypothetical protein